MPNSMIPPPRAERRPGRIRIVGPALTCAVFALAGLLFYSSARTAQGTDLRTDDSLLRLSDVIQQRSTQNQEIQAQIGGLHDRVDKLAGDQSQDPADTARVDALERTAGLEPLRGPGLTVTLNDAPPNATARIPGVPEPGVNDLVIHQQDIQAVVNALWDGGAEAMTIQGQRVVSTTGIRCVGNSVVLHDVPYAPPYVIRAIGPTSEMLDSINASPYIGFYLEAVAAFQLGWAVDIDPVIDMPAYTGSIELNYARPVEDPI